MKANSMKTTLSLLLLTTAACGQVVDSTDPAGPADDQVALDEAPPLDPGEPPTTAKPIIATEAPRAATTQHSLFAMSFAQNSPLSHLVSPVEGTRIDIVEQKVVALTDEAIELVVELAPPTGRYDRVIVSDVIRRGNGEGIVEYVLCQSNGWATFDPKCNTTEPTSRETAGSGALTASQWRIRVVDDETGAQVGDCSTSGTSLTCQLPGRAGASYRVVTSAWGFEDLWDGTAIAETGFMGHYFTGAVLATPEHLCWDWWTNSAGTADYCRVRYDYDRFTSLDRARLELDPIAITVTANGVASTQASPALTWDGGNEDLPGVY